MLKQSGISGGDCTRSSDLSFGLAFFTGRAFPEGSSLLTQFGLILILASLFCQSLVAQAQQAANLQVGHDFWGFKEGAPGDVSGIAQTSDGFLWLATPTGLFRFDGTRFERFRSPFGDQLLSNNLRTVFAPPSGGLWIGYTYGGFSFLHTNGRLTNYGGEAASSGTVNNFAQDQNGNLWAGAASGLWRFDGSLWQHLGAEWNAPAGRVYEVGFDSQGLLWVLAGSQPSLNLLYLRPGTGHFQTAERNLNTFGFTLDANRAVVTGPQGKSPVPNSSSGEQTFGHPITSKDSAAIIDRTGSIWVFGLDSSIRRLPPSDQPYRALNQPAASHSEVYPIDTYGPADNLMDREGNVWFGEAKGLHRFFYSPLIRLEEAPKDVGYYALAADDNGAVWIATNKQLQHFSHGKIDATKKLDVTVLQNFAFRAPDRTFWFATDRELWHLAGRTWTRVALPPDMADQVSFLQTITQDSQSGMWISFGRHGLFRMANGVWTPYGGHEDLPKTGVVIEFTDQQGRVWFGYTKNTLAVLDGDRVQVFGPSDGLRVGNVTAIQGRGAAIWIGGEFGLQQYDQGHFHNIHAVDDELLRGISGIVETAKGDLWLNGLSGIFHIPHTEISEARKDPDYLVKGEHFGRREGLLGLAFQLRPLNTAVEGTDGRLWFTGSSGVVSVDPAQSEKKVPAAPTTILSVSADDKFYPPGGPLQLPAHTSNVQISFAAVSLSDPEAVSYRYKLQETDKDWHVVPTASPVSYHNLAPGSYHFRVNATDINGVWSDKVATAEFTILPAYYQKRWFLGLCIAAALTMFYLLYLLRLRQVAQQFRVRMEERTRIARELHDTLLQSFQGVLLRFQSASNVLPASTDVAEANMKLAEVKMRLTGAIEQASQAITEGRDAVQGLRSSTMVSGDLAAALGALGEELSAVGSNQNPPAFHVEVQGTSRELKPILRDEVYRIAGEALRNAFRHAQARRVEVVIHYDDSELIVHVRDDGKGIGSQILGDQGRVGHWGLQGMSERARKIGAQLEVWSRPESGTEVELKIPTAKAYAAKRGGGKGVSFGLVVSLFLYFFFLGESLAAQAQQAANLQVGHDFWGFKEGAPEDVSGIAQTSDGFLWLATPTGLFRFDGTRFERFRSPFGDQLLSNNLRSVFAPPSGGLWIGYTYGGFSFLQSNGRLTNYSGEAASSGTIENFDQDQNGNLWAATSGGLWRFDGSGWRHLGAEWNVPAGRIYQVAFDSKGVLWVLAGSLPSFDLLYLRPNSGHFQTAERNLHIFGFTLDANSAVVTGSRFKPRVPNSTSDEQTSGYPITMKDSAAIIDRTGSIWVGSLEGGLRRLPPNDQPFQALSQLAASNSEVYPVNLYAQADKLVDREGNVWFGESKGLHRFFYSPLIRLDEVPKDVEYYAVAADDNGAVWIATKKQLQHFSLGKSDALKQLEGSTSFTNFAFRAHDRTFWFATDREFWHLAGRTWTSVLPPPNVADQVTFLQTITQDSQGGMWISFGRHGLFRFANGVWTPYGGREDLPKTGVVIEFTDQQGRVWFGYTKNTLAVLDGDRVQVFGPSDGLRVGNVTAIQGRGAAIWIGGEFGLQQYDQGRFHNIHAVDDELLRGISGIVETAKGDLWLNGLSGIFHIPHTEISEARKDPNYLVKGEHFGRREGLLGLAFQLRPLNTAVEGTDGRLWFTGSGGVVSVNPAQSEKKASPAPATILSVSADDKFYPPGGPLRLPAHTSNVQISFAAVSLSDPEAISYRYKLQETDKDWHVVGTASPVSYRNLAPGPYHFSVDATDTNGVWSDKVATAEFTILPAYYQTRWFLVLCIVAALIALYLLYLLRLRQVAQQFRVRMEERTRIARDLHDTLLQSFQGILLRFQSASNVLPASPDEAKERLDTAIEQAAQAITEGRDAVQDLRSSTMQSGDLAAALSTLGEELGTVGSDHVSPAFHVEVEGTSRELQPILRDEVYRIAGEALRNAFRHAQARRVEVVLHYDDSDLTLVVRDDGKGIDSQILEDQARVGHWGLQGMRERARKVGGKLEIWSRLESGTEVELQVPAAKAYQTSGGPAKWFSFWRSSGLGS